MKPLAIATALIATLALGGCAQEIAVEPTPTPTATPTPTPTPEPVAERLVVGSDAMTVIADNGETLATYDYFQDPQGVVVELTDLFGFAPSVKQIQPYEGIPYLESDWSGFRILDLDRETDGVLYSSYWVEITAATISAITVETVEGIAVGDDAEPVERAHPETTEHITPPNTGIPRYLIDVDILPLPSGYTFSVSLSGEVGSPIERIFAPAGGGPSI